MPNWEGKTLEEILELVARRWGVKFTVKESLNLLGLALLYDEGELG